MTKESTKEPTPEETLKWQLKVESSGAPEIIDIDADEYLKQKNARENTTDQPADKR